MCVRTNAERLISDFRFEMAKGSASARLWRRLRKAMAAGRAVRRADAARIRRGRQKDLPGLFLGFRSGRCDAGRGHSIMDRHLLADFELSDYFSRIAAGDFPALIALLADNGFFSERDDWASHLISFCRPSRQSALKQKQLDATMIAKILDRFIKPFPI